MPEILTQLNAGGVTKEHLDYYKMRQASLAAARRPSANALLFSREFEPPVPSKEGLYYPSTLYVPPYLSLPRARSLRKSWTSIS
ncbi:hypothetical protein RUND412_001077 [Rhizina undulata]